MISSLQALKLMKRSHFISRFALDSGQTDSKQHKGAPSGLPGRTGDGMVITRLEDSEVCVWVKARSYSEIIRNKPSNHLEYET